MKHSNIAIFVPHAGCPNQCSFCDQRAISATLQPPSVQEVESILTGALSMKNRECAEIAFFGGSFTAIERGYMVSLLETASRFVGADGFSAIRISTRPDCIDSEILSLLKRYGVTAIELGAQSMDDGVLTVNRRGHTSKQVEDSAALIKASGFELGLQMMVGLYGDTKTLIRQTCERIIELQPDTVRIYPTVVLKNTHLAQLLEQGDYVPMSIESAVELCADLLSRFEAHGIRVIKLGLHASQEVEKQMFGGIYHPAFRELCESRMMFSRALEQLEALDIKFATIYVAPSAISKMIGQKHSNIAAFGALGYDVCVKADDTLSGYDLHVTRKE